MKKKTVFGIIVSIVLLCASCKSTEPAVYLELASPEEYGLNLVKITDEAKGNVIGCRYGQTSSVNYVNAQCGFNEQSKLAWTCYPNLQVSPSGDKLAYLTTDKEQCNIIVRNTNSQGISTQRTFRNVVGGFAWGSDDRLYFSDGNSSNSYICSVDANKGSVMLQHTSGNVDDAFPILSSDGKIIYFTRWVSSYGPSIWAFNKESGTLSSCARGFNPCPVPNDNESFYCVRNSTSGRSEIWFVNYVNGTESIVLSDVNHGFTSPALSPDGKWLLVVGNSKSSISKKENTDIFVVRTDGTQLTQLTYHPAFDVCPVWSKDGKSIFFISSRANKEGYYNIWKMNFNL